MDCEKRIIDEKKLIDDISRHFLQKIFGEAGEYIEPELLAQNKEICRIINAQPTVDAVELPCKIGQVVYHQLERWRDEINIQPFQVTSMSISQNKKGEWKKSFRISWLDGDKTRDPCYDHSFDDIGKTVFFTREEAEKAWERENSDGKID